MNAVKINMLILRMAPPKALVQTLSAPYFKQNLFFDGQCRSGCLVFHLLTKRESRGRGRVAQLGEHQHGMLRVAGSIPVTSTRFLRHFRDNSLPKISSKSKITMFDEKLFGELA